MQGLSTGIRKTASSLGMNPADLATIISYETGGTFDPAQPGPTTQWGQHRGLIQFGEPQAKQYGVNWDDPLGSQLGENGAIARYFRDNGWQPGMGLLDAYSIVNAGAPGRYNASDANNGGAPGTVADKVRNQMGGHRKNAMRLLGEDGGITMSTRNAPQQPMSAMQPQGQAAQRPQSIWERMGLLQDEDKRHRLAMALEGMTLNPNQALIGSLQSGIEGRRADREEAEAEAEVQKRRNATADWLRRNGSEDLASLIDEGVSADRVFSLYRAQGQAANDPSVQSSQPLPDASGSVLTMRDGSQKVVTAGGETLTGQDAMDFVSRAQESYTEQQRSIYGARRAGTLGADIEMGGEAARVGEEGKDIAQLARTNLEAASAVGSNIGNIDTAIDALQRGADAGAVYNRLPRLDEASASLQNAMDQMGLDVIGSVTFGALSAAELRLAMETAVPRNLNSEELLQWLQRRREAQIKARAGLLEAAEYFANGGDMAGWVERVKAMQGGGDAPAGEAGQPDVPVESGDDLSPEAKRYLGID